MEDGHSLLSKNQVWHYGIKIDDDPYFSNMKIEVEDQVWESIDLHYKDGLTYFQIFTPTQWDIEKLPIVTLTCDKPWLPQMLDSIPKLGITLSRRAINKEAITINDLAPRLGTSNKQIIELTLKTTTWLGALDPCYLLWNHIKVQLLKLGLHHLPEPFSMDTVFPVKGEVHRDFNGNTCMQFFVGMELHYIFGVLLCYESEGPGALQDFFDMSDVSSVYTVINSRCN